jgi:acyl-CoA reductase-like NAD-dependent aldehyde dehydrogenase
MLDGQIYYPTIQTNAPLDTAIANEETIGPVVVVEVVDPPDKAIAAANRTDDGCLPMEDHNTRIRVVGRDAPKTRYVAEARKGLQAD